MTSSTRSNDVNTNWLPGWDHVAVALDAIAATRPGDGSGLDVRVSAPILRTARVLWQRWAATPDVLVPDSVYPLPDGEVVFEYRLLGGVVVRYIIEGGGRGQQMISSADGRPAQFTDFFVRSDDRFHAAFERRRGDRRWGGLTEFDLAA